jgi:hypothetical protein
MKGTTKTRKKVAIQRDNHQKGSGKVHGNNHQKEDNKNQEKGDKAQKDDHHEGDD